MDEIEYRTPGQLIQHLLDARGWTQRVLAIVLRISESALNKIIAGKQPLDAGLSLALGDVFGIAPERFLDLQKRYELSQARIVEQPDPKRASRAALFGDLPVTDMIKRGWLDADDIRDTAKIEKALVKFFGVSALDEIEILPHAAKKTRVATPTTPGQLAWLYRVRDIASDMLVAKYTASNCQEAIEQLKPLLASAEGVRKIPKILTEAGIRFVIVEALPTTKIDGACLWINETSPVIGMAIRFDRIDNFWFVLRHEIEHVLRQHGRTAAILDTELEGERAGVGAGIPEEERQANEAASNFCVPGGKIERFIALKSPFFAERDILGFARTIGVHPGLVAGQLQFRTGRYDRFRNHLVKVRNMVSPGSVVDGWGDVAPVGY